MGILEKRLKLYLEKQRDSNRAWQKEIDTVQKELDAEIGKNDRCEER
jgi:hypothetical protein